MNRNITPVGAIRITTYENFRRHIAAFESGWYPFPIVIGASGLGKSRAIKEAMKDRDHLLLDNVPVQRRRGTGEIRSG